MSTPIINSQMDAINSTLGALNTDLASLRTAMKDNLAHIDGYYEDMTVGDAEQLVSTQGVTDTEPYLFRTTGGSSDVGNRLNLRSIVGGTIAWNQLVQNIHKSVTITNANTGYTLYTLENVSFSVNHVYLFNIDAIVSANGRYRLRYPQVDVDVTENYRSIRKISASDYLSAFSIQTYSTDGENATFEFDNITLFDLTQMFGSTVADYIYNLEQSTAGAGVALFRSMFPKPYYEYNAGELISVQGLTSHDMVGFNQWDEQWEYVNSRVTSKNYIPVIPSTEYFFANTKLYDVDMYDANKNSLGHPTYTQVAGVGFKFTTAQNCTFIKFSVANSYGATYNHDICINLSWSGTHNGEYEPYVKYSYPLDSSLTLRGVPKLVNNQIQYDGDTYEPNGKVTRKYGIVDLGTLNWSYTSGYFLSSAISGRAKQYNGLVCAKYIEAGNVTMANAPDKSVRGSYTDTPIYIKDSAYTDAAAFKTAMSGVYLVYELATPTEETATAYQELQICNDWGTEEFVIDSSVSIPVPVGHDTFFSANLRDKLQHLPDLASADGYYLVQQSGTQMSLIAFHIPRATGLADGTYTLKATVSGGTPTYSWVLDS